MVIAIKQSVQIRASHAAQNRAFVLAFLPSLVTLYKLNVVALVMMMCMHDGSSLCFHYVLSLVCAQFYTLTSFSLTPQRTS